jgi:hypothetical protein
MTDGSGDISNVTDSVTARTLTDRILSLLTASDIPLSPKTIASKLGANHGSVKKILTRLRDEKLILNEGTGYIHIRATSEAKRHDLEMLRSYEEVNRPLLHDIHLTFKPEESFGKSVQSDKTIPSLSIPCLDEHQKRILDATFGVSPANPLAPYLNPVNTMNPHTFYQIWNENKVEDIKGGIQEVIQSPRYRLTIQLFGTGTIKIIVANSETPFDLDGFRDFKHELNGVFLARTGVPFEAIQHLFYFESLHINRDKVVESRTGLSNRNFTIQWMENWLLRVYEKEIDGKQVVRDEKVLVDGNYSDHSLNTMMAVMEGGWNPTLLTANDFAQMNSITKLTDMMMEVVKTVKLDHRILMSHLMSQNRG